jgi:hypothetical protein
MVLSLDYGFRARDVSFWTQVIVPFQEGEKKMKEETDKAEADKRAKEVRFHQI